MREVSRLRVLGVLSDPVEPRRSPSPGRSLVEQLNPNPVRVADVRFAPVADRIGLDDDFNALSSEIPDGRHKIFDFEGEMIQILAV